jgi:hypothetical protein
MAAGQAPDAEREKDVYAIYSLMMTNPVTSHGPGGNQRLLIADVTMPGEPEGPCVKPPKERFADFQLVMEYFEVRKGTQRRLERKLSIETAYEYLSVDEVEQFQQERFPKKPGTTRSQRFRGIIDVFTFSDVYFNPSRTLALTAMSSWCGGRCALYRWMVFEKNSAGTWEERPKWISCTLISFLRAAEWQS